MNTFFKHIYLLVALVPLVTPQKSIAAEAMAKPYVSMFAQAAQCISVGPKAWFYAKATAATFLAGYLCHQYYKHKQRPKDEDLFEAGYKRRFYEILYGKHSFISKLKLLVRFIDDFYVFGRRPKTVEITTKVKNSDGSITVTKDKKTIIKGTGPIAFLYENVFDGFEGALKSLGTLFQFLLIVDNLAAGKIDFLINPSSAKYQP